MKKLGLIGGMSWESSLLYYKIINERVRTLRGDLCSAELMMYSFDFQSIEELQHKNKWFELTELMISTAKKLEVCGAEAIVICTNTMHITADAMQHELEIPVLHIADATATRITTEKVKKVGLLGTKFTMEKEFYKGRLIDRHGIDVIIPEEEDREIVHNVIYKELCAGEIKASSREQYKNIIKKLADNGAEGVILGCTEIPMLISQADADIPIYDTTTLHALYAADFSVE